MRFFFDTEFIDDGKTLDLISIGVVQEGGAAYYAENYECDLEKANPWVRENVLPQLQGGRFSTPRCNIGREVLAFIGQDKPEIWGYYADYDWVILCQLFGPMMSLPKGWPMYCRDIKQLCDFLGSPKLPGQGKGEHHALLDAQWNRKAYKFLTEDMWEGYPGIRRKTEKH